MRIFLSAVLLFCVATVTAQPAMGVSPLKVAESKSLMNSASNDVLRRAHLDYPVTNMLERIAERTIQPVAVVTNKAALKTLMHRIRAGVPDTNGWYLAESTGGHFKVRMPAPFNDFMVIGTDEQGKAVKYSTVGVLTEEGTKYSATLLPDKADKPEAEYFEGFADNFRKQGTLKNVRRLTYRNLPALEILVGDQRRSARMRVIYARPDVYSLIVEYDTHQTNELTSRIATFFDSLEFQDNK